MDHGNECKPQAPKAHSPPPTEGGIGSEQVVEQVNALTSLEDKPCGSPEHESNLPMQDAWRYEISAGHPLYCMVTMHAAEPSKSETHSCTGLLGGQFSRHQSWQASDRVKSQDTVKFQNKVRKAKKASSETDDSTDYSGMTQEEKRIKKRQKCNRESARRSRARKVAETDDLKKKNAVLEVALREKNEALREEKKALRQRDEALEEMKKALRQKDEALEEKKKALREKEEALSRASEDVGKVQSDVQGIRGRMSRQHKGFRDTLGVLNPENYLVDDDTYPADPEIERWDSMQQNEGGVDDFLAFDIAAIPEGLFRPGDEAIQVAQPGGEATMCLREIPDMPRVAAGEEILPLWPDQNQIFTLVPLTTELGDPQALKVTVVGRRASQDPV